MEETREVFLFTHKNWKIFRVSDNKYVAYCPNKPKIKSFSWKLIRSAIDQGNI